MTEEGSYTFANAPRVRWGPGCAGAHLAAELDRLGARRVFLVTTRSAEADPALAPRVAALLGDRLVGRHAAIGAHAPARDVAAAAEAARAARPDALVSLGGGSPIDAAKVVAFALATGLDPAAADAARRARGLAATGALPHVALPTTLSAAEQSGSAGFSAGDPPRKTGLAAPELVPALVLYDAQLAARTPLPLWLSTGVRALDHAVEGLLAPGSRPVADALALEALRRLPAALRAARADPADLEARTQGQLGAWLSYGNLDAAAGIGHMLGKRLGATHGIPHGVTSCLLLPHVLRRRAREAPATAAAIAAALGAADGADALAGLVRELGLPHRLRDFALSDADLAEAARPLASDAWPAGELLALLRAAW